MAVVVVWRIAEMVPNLQLWRDAPNRPSSNLAFSLQTLGGVQTVGAFTQRLPSVSTFIHYDRVQVHMPTARSNQDEPGGQSRLDTWVVLEAQVS